MNLSQLEILVAIGVPEWSQLLKERLKGNSNALDIRMAEAAPE